MNVGPCHHHMACPQAAAGGRPPIWRVAVNKLNSSRGQPTRAGPPAWGLGEVLTTPLRKKVC
jgi:hypothetical protein